VMGDRWWVMEYVLINNVLIVENFPACLRTTRTKSPSPSAPGEELG
jgi:hypothetical protein